MDNKDNNGLTKTVQLKLIYNYYIYKLIYFFFVEFRIKIKMS